MTGVPGHEAAANLPAVEPHVVAEIVGALSARLAKRLDPSVAKLQARPRVWSQDGTELRIAVDEDAELVLRTDGGVVTSAEAVTCSCLLAPACLHRAAAVSAAPLAQPQSDAVVVSDSSPSPGSTAESSPASPPPAIQAASAGAESAPASGETDASPDHLTPREREVALAVWQAGAAILTAGTSGSGAMLQAELLRAGHAAALAGLHRAAAAAFRVTALVRDARDGVPSFRLADLRAALRELLLVAYELAADSHDRYARSDTLATLRGVARQSYSTAGSLRLYGLFTEPILTDTHAGSVTCLVDRHGVISSVADVLPHDGTPDPAAARAAAGSTVRLGDAVLTHAQLSSSGLNLSGATRSATGRLGTGRGVRAVGASGANWAEEPLSVLWAQSLIDQLDRALATRSLPMAERQVGTDLLFLDLTLLGPADGQLLAVVNASGAPVVLLPAHSNPGLAYARNLAALAGHPGLPLRVIGRLATTDRPALHLLAAEIEGQRVNLGLSQLPVLPPATRPATSHPAAAPTTDNAPTHLLLRRTERALVSGRRALHHDSSAPADSARLHQAALPTAAALLDALHSAARNTPRNAFGRSHPDNPTAFARSWLAADTYLSAFAAARCKDLWLGTA